ncbi:hypothetical protein HK098_003249 [Nowakowskiella sp. JEL0407]|nr:hypothetical protein HK098_003249 [Nowakowskiella sp. JEL0407]
METIELLRFISHKHDSQTTILIDKINDSATEDKKWIADLLSEFNSVKTNTAENYKADLTQLFPKEGNKTSQPTKTLDSSNEAVLPSRSVSDENESSKTTNTDTSAALPAATKLSADLNVNKPATPRLHSILQDSFDVVTSKLFSTSLLKSNTQPVSTADSTYKPASEVIDLKKSTDSTAPSKSELQFPPNTAKSQSSLTSLLASASYTTNPTANNNQPNLSKFKINHLPPALSLTVPKLVKDLSSQFASKPITHSTTPLISSSSSLTKGESSTKGSLDKILFGLKEIENKKRERSTTSDHSVSSLSSSINSSESTFIGAVLPALPESANENRESSLGSQSTDLEFFDAKERLSEIQIESASTSSDKKLDAGSKEEFEVHITKKDAIVGNIMDEELEVDFGEDEIGTLYPSLNDLNGQNDNNRNTISSIDSGSEGSVWSSISQASVAPITNISSKPTFVNPTNQPAREKKKFEVKALQVAAALAKKEREQLAHKKELLMEKRRLEEQRKEQAKKKQQQQIVMKPILSLMRTKDQITLQKKPSHETLSSASSSLSTNPNLEQPVDHTEDDIQSKIQAEMAKAEQLRIQQQQRVAAEAAKAEELKRQQQQQRAAAAAFAAANAAKAFALEKAERDKERVAASIVDADGEIPDIPDSEDEDEYHSDDEDLQKPKTTVGKPLPDWVLSPNLKKALANQTRQDPDEIFGAVQPLALEDVFKGSKRTFRARTSSAHWTGTDRLTEYEQERYKEKMGYISKKRKGNNDEEYVEY